jgi:hypothetical protein
VNLMQAVVETLLFYHPAVWWISARIRVEREHCCDDAAIAVCGNPLLYARALTRLEELRADATQLALAANGGSLLARIRRVAGIRSESPSAPSRWAAGAALLTVVVALLFVPSLPMFARDQASTPPPAPPAAPNVVAATPAPPAPPAVAGTRIEVRADDADDADLDVPEPPEPPEPAEEPQAAPSATPRPATPRTPRPPRPARCPDSIDLHLAPMAMPAMPKFEIPPMDIHIDQEAIRQGVRQAVEAQRMARDMVKMQRDMTHAFKPDKKYVESLRGAGLKATDSEAMQLHMMGITPRYVQSLRDAGLKKLTARDVIRLHSMSITAGFVKDLKRMQQ